MDEGVRDRCGGSVTKCGLSLTVDMLRLVYGSYLCREPAGVVDHRQL
jgi:hypothetical protein